jgi:hypothetical protein
VNWAIAWRAGALQAVFVAIVAVVLGAALTDDFFADWGWAAGPGVWAACALAVARMLRLEALPTLAGAALAGLPSLVGVAAGVHWAGAPLGILIFAAWCGRRALRLPAQPRSIDGT